MSDKQQLFLRDTDIAAMQDCHRTTIWRGVQDGLLPPPIRLSAGTTRWIGREIEAIHAARIAGADDDAIRALVRELVAARQQAKAA